jgi:DNA polymerase-3 subunit gamma/tau
MSENYIVSARKYRPSTFSTVVGQQALTHTLKTAIASHRLAHAYLFCGPRGVGKTTCARIFAKAINCEHLTPEGEPCNECESCRAFNEQRSYNIVELDAASNNSVDDIRGITDQVRIPPQVGRYRVFIIDEVHMLSTAAFNAFLKTLEEPPEYAIFILATTEKQKIIPTILSRCQIYDFNRIRVPDIVKQLQYICKDRGVEAETAALNVIAEKADGAMRDALSIFDQVSASSEGHITYQSTIDNLNVLDYDYYFRLDEAFLKADVPAALLIYKEIRDKGFDSQFFVNGLAQHMRNLMVASNQLTVKLLEMNDDVAGRFVEMAARFSPGFFYRAMDLCNYCDLNYRDASNKIFIVELTLIKICQLLGTPLPPTGGSPTRLKKTPAAPATPPAAQAPAPSPAPHAQASAHLAASSSPAAPAAAPQRAATSVSGPAAGPAAHHPRAVIKTPHIYINNTAAAAAERTGQQGPAPSGTQGTARREPFTAQQVAAAWQDYIAAHPHDRLVINIMKTVTPKQIDAENYEITVNDAQYDFINNTMSKILAHVRDAVKNDMLAIAVKLGKSGQAPKIWTDREIVDDLRKHHPEMDEVIKDWGLGLA